MGKTILSRNLKPTGLPVFSASVALEPWGYTDEHDVVFRRGTIVISARGTIGDVKVPNYDEFVSTQTTIALSPSFALDPHFLARQLKIYDWPAVTATTAIPMLTIGKVDEIEVAIAPLAEQRRIVAKLDALTARTARARADLDRIPALAARYKQAVLAKAFAGQLTVQWRRENPNSVSSDFLRSEIMHERQLRRRAEGIRGTGANRSVPTGERVLPEIPLGWTWMTFDECAWDLTVGHVGPMKDRYVDGGVPFLRSLNVKANEICMENLVSISDDFHRLLAKSRLRPGTIVVIRTGEPGVAAVIPSDLDDSNCSDLVICRPLDQLNPHYAARYINSDFAKRYVYDNQVGVAQQHFNVGAMSKLPVPIAPLAEQAEIVRAIDHAFAEIDRLTGEAAAARRLLDRLDQAILARAFRGELVPQDPTDEPASVLLARIKAARAAAPTGARRGHKAKAACAT